MKKSRLAPLVALAASALLLTGCGVNAGTSDAGSGSGASGEITGKISFQTWNLKANFQEYFEGVVDDFEAEYPGTEVTWIDQPAEGYADKLSADAAAGTLPDVVNLDPGTGYPLAQAGMLLNLAEADPDAAEQYLPEAWAAMDWKALGGNFGYPWYLNTGPSLFNKALFAEAGMDTEALPSTYDELFEQAGTMAKTASGKYAMLGRTPNIEVFGMYGVELMNKGQTEFTFNNAKGVELVERYIKLYEEGAFLPESLSQDYTGVDKSFQAGKIAFMPGSAYNVTQIEENAPTIFENLAIEPIITNEKPNMYIQLVAVSEASKNQATAKAFAKFVTNAQSQLDFAKVVNIFPSTVGSLDDPFFTETDGTSNSEVRAMSAAQIKDAVVYSPASFTEPMKSELRDQLAQAMLGEKSAQEALDAVVEYANSRLSN